MDFQSLTIIIGVHILPMMDWHQIMFIVCQLMDKVTIG